MTGEQREMISLAYGLLWHVHGDGSAIENIRLAFTARHALFLCLTKEERAQGIAAAKDDPRFKVSWDVT
jgi:hypothetical protein